MSSVKKRGLGRDRDRAHKTRRVDLDDEWNDVSATVNSTFGVWYALTCPIANLTASDHLMDVLFWSGSPLCGWH